MDIMKTWLGKKARNKDKAHCVTTDHDSDT